MGLPYARLVRASRALITRARRPAPDRRRDVQVQAPFAGQGTISARRPTRSWIKPREEILFGGGRRFRVLDVVPFAEAYESPFVGMLKVEVA